MGGDWGNVMVVQPRVERVFWCSGRTRGRGEVTSGGLVSKAESCSSCWPGTCLLRLRSREINFAMENERSGEVVGDTTAMLVTTRVLAVSSLGLRTLVVWAASKAVVSVMGVSAAEHKQN